MSLARGAIFVKYFASKSSGARDPVRRRRWPDARRGRPGGQHRCRGAVQVVLRPEGTEERRHGTPHRGGSARSGLTRAPRRRRRHVGRLHPASVRRGRENGSPGGRGLDPRRSWTPPQSSSRSEASPTARWPPTRTWRSLRWAVELSDLRLLADFGLGGVAPEELRALADLAEEHCFASGDVRYSIIHRALVRLGNLWEERGAVPLDRVRQMDDVLESRLPGVLGANLDEGRRQALGLLREVRTLTDRLTVRARSCREARWRDAVGSGRRERPAGLQHLPGGGPCW